MPDELDELDAATRVYARTEAAHEKARQEAIAAVVAALRAGHRPAEVGRRSPFTDAYVRKLARLNGIAPDSRYVRTRPIARGVARNSGNDTGSGASDGPSERP